MKTTKNTRKDKDGWTRILCKCGSTRQISKFTHEDDHMNSDGNAWVEIDCARCGIMLFYNGA